MRDRARAGDDAGFGAAGAPPPRPSKMQGPSGTGHYEGTVAGTRRLTASTAADLSPMFPSTTPAMMIVAPAQIQVTNGLTKIRNDPEPLELTPTSTT